MQQQVPSNSLDTAMATTKLTLKLLIDKKGNRVLFGEAGKDFVDFLFSLLSLPIGSVMRLLRKQQMIGCLGNLYESVENLNETYVQPNQNKDSLLKLKAVTCAANVPLLLPTEDATPGNYYLCGNCGSYITNNPEVICPDCMSTMSTEVTYVPPNADKAASMVEGGYVKGVVTYMVMDDLAVMPMSTISCITLLNKLKVEDVSSLVEKVVDLGVEEGLEILKASMQSKTALTDVFLRKKEK